jgi:hypothetical protein
MVVVKGGYSEYPLLKGANPDSAECQVTKTLTNHIQAHFIRAVLFSGLEP